MHYRAFISHSHADAKFAAWLQRAIETWRVPTRLRAELGYSRIKPIFRDRTDLRAATSLGDALEDALRHSSALIVVCSNDAADSDWVDQEIARYREFNPDAPILPIIAAGEPPHCFPESLLTDANGNALEPLAADARKGFDGKRDALLKTIAGIIDVDFDVLKQRDFRRRQQKMGAVAALATSVAAVTLYLAYMAYEARDDANRRLEQADDLIAFMLGDLRDKLEPIRKLDILDAVGDEALSYFAEFERDDYSPSVKLKHALALRQIGEVKFAQGQNEDALEAFGQGDAVLKSIESGSVGEEQLLFETAQFQFWQGYVFLDRDDFGEARPYFQRYLELTRLLADQYPGELNQREYSYAYSNLGALEMFFGDLDKAEHYLDKNLVQIERLDSFVHSADELLEDYQQTYSWLGEVKYRQGDLTASIDWYSKELEIADQLFLLTEDPLYSELIAQSALRLTEPMVLLGYFEGAQRQVERAHDISSQLVRHDPDNRWWTSLFNASIAYHARVSLLLGDPERALDVLADSWLNSGEDWPEILASTNSVGTCVQLFAYRAAAQADIGDLGAAHATLEEARGVVVEIESPDNEEELLPALAELRLIEGRVLAASYPEADSFAAWERGLEAAELGLVISRDPYLLMIRGALENHLGKTDSSMSPDIAAGTVVGSWVETDPILNYKTSGS